MKARIRPIVSGITVCTKCGSEVTIPPKIIPITFGTTATGLAVISDFMILITQKIIIAGPIR
ncbi:MAG: hypothetical protein K2O29_08290 [Ruminococcus sp.]|nr:hypothetical protein [Ruminococcus sp.]